MTESSEVKTGNIQHSNVGNKGDILKHAALMRLSQLLGERNKETNINYLDTHTFLLTAKVADSDLWRSETNELLRSHPDYESYIEMELADIESGLYKCSTLLIAECLPKARLFLAESDDDTYRELNLQLDRLGLTPAAVMTDMFSLMNADLGDYAGALLALVDPFYESDEEWREIWSAASAGITALHKPGSDGIIEVYQYRKEGDPLWCEAPQGFVGPIATIQSEWHNIGVYATETIAGEATSILTGLGWKQHI